MERLTKRDENGDVDLIGMSRTEIYSLDFSSFIPIIDAIQRLAAYEDTGLSPQEISKMKHELENLRNTVEYYERKEELQYESELGDDI